MDTQDGYKLCEKNCTYNLLPTIITLVMQGVLIAWRVILQLPGNEKPLTADPACWYLNERSCYEEFEHGILTVIIPSTKIVELIVERVNSLNPKHAEARLSQQLSSA